MSEDIARNPDIDELDTAPGQESAIDQEITHGVRTYLIGLGLAVLLTALAFWLPTTQLVWGPGIPIALIVFAIAQMGVHLVFFLHITTAPDNTNNVLALAFGVLIVALVIAGSLWIMENLNDRLMPLDQMLQMQVKQNPSLAQYEPQMRAFLNKYLSWASMKEDMLNIYTTEFTEDELKQLTAFTRRRSERRPSLARKPSAASTTPSTRGSPTSTPRRITAASRT